MLWLSFDSLVELNKGKFGIGHVLCGSIGINAWHVAWNFARDHLSRALPAELQQLQCLLMSDQSFQDL